MLEWVDMRFLLLPYAGPWLAAAFQAVSASFRVAPAPKRTVSAALAATCLLTGLVGCSLSLEDPEVEARKKLAKLVDANWDLLEGRWLGDSTYTIFDIRASTLAGSLVMDFFPDSTVWAADTSRLIFPGRISARGLLLDESLRLDPAPLAGGKDTFTVRMRFLGNWLELDRQRDQRFIHLHKVKPIDSLTRAALLDSGLWLRMRHRITHDTTSIEALRSDFEYLRFSGDSLYRDSRRNGLALKASGPLRKDGRRWTWTPASGSRTLHLDLYHPDSLRFWPFDSGKPDSGYYLFTRVMAEDRNDLDMTSYLGELRTDSIKTSATALENHFGRYYDLVLGKDYGVTSLTNMPDMPRFSKWVMDSGFLWMEGAGTARTRFSVRKISPSALNLLSDSGHGFPSPTTLMQTIVDSARIAANPLERFERAGYMHIEIGSDTLAYYFLSNSGGTSLEEHEIARIATDDTLWAAWRINPTLETFGSSQSGFFFAFSGNTAALGRFTCMSLPVLDLALRTTASADPSLAKGLVQGRCRIIQSQKPPADSTLSITGQFQSRRRDGRTRSSLWNLP